MRDGFKARLVLVTTFAVLFFSVLLARFYYVQVHRHDELLSKAQKKYTAKRLSKGRRGMIFDSTRSPAPNILAMTRVTYEVFAEPRHMGSRKWEVFEILKKETGVSDALLRPRFENEKLVQLVVAKGVTIDKVMKLREMKLPGLHYEESQSRFYPKNTLASNVLGFMGHKGNGVMGIESKYDKEMTPTSGEVVIERSRRNKELHTLKSINPKDGWDVYLTISEPIQSFMEEELDRLVSEIPCKSVYAMMTDPRTGGILAMAQRPTFNPNQRSTMTRDKYANRLLEDVFEPGSIMKACSIAVVMSLRNISFNDRIDCEDGMWFHSGKPLRDAGHHYGTIPIWQVIQKSSNIGTAKLAISVGKNAMYAGLRRFGFGERTGLNLGTESRGIFRSANKWDGLSISRMPIGQGIAVTVPQMMQAWGALANDGNMMQLRVVDKVKKAGTEEVIEYPPLLKRRVLPLRVTQGMTNALKTVTRDGGTAPKAHVPGYYVAGKTGTSQKWVNNAYSNTIHVASFVGYAPADNPAFVLMVVVDEPAYKYRYGGTAAAPTFRRIAEKTLRYLNVKPDLPEEISDEVK
ncbi:penicillin-binding protein 2 [Lentisphaera profundi]|uniref:Penicillin-binding protein 2 n=1 Tax=Lentisphaera profundi TaxID=1658616 RepID=A0ABY7VPP5_9BACT|nr:penicillin-binding protein 2 [Lentisphaera profundi]WDE95677.1 penicillin-binding protein 2 [Lentisphaera profundi]